VDDEILDHIEVYGFDWLEDTYKLIMEDRRTQFGMLATMIPLALTPMSKQAAKGHADLGRRVNKMIDSMTPWIKPTSDLRKRVKSGTVAVLADAGDDLKNPLFKDAHVRKG